MATKLAYIGVAVLAIIAVILGYKIYQQQTAINDPLPITQQPQNKSTPQPLVNQATPEATQQNPTSSQTTAADIAAVLNFPGPNASEAERKTHSDLVNKLGNQSGVPSLDISGCTPNPVVYRVKLNATFKVKNSDQVDHTIYNGSKRITIRTSSEQSVESKALGDNVGDFGYSCDGVVSSVGILQIRE